jgi:hypothetical protein
MPQLRRRARRAPAPAGGKAAEIPRVERTSLQAERVRMKPDAKLERKIVRMLGQFLADEQAALGRSRAVAWAWIISGSLLWTVAVFGYAQPAGGHWILAVLSGVGGVCLGIGLWFSTFVEQWPAMRQFIDAERVRQRSRELDAPVPK